MKIVFIQLTKAFLFLTDHKSFPRGKPLQKISLLFGKIKGKFRRNIVGYFKNLIILRDEEACAESTPIVEEDKLQFDDWEDWKQEELMRDKMEEESNAK